MASFTETDALTSDAARKQKGGNTEGGRMSQILANTRCLVVAEAIKKARADNCCPVPSFYSTRRNQVPLESTWLEGKLADCARVDAQRAALIAATPLRGMSEGARIRILQQQTEMNFAPASDPNSRFIEYRRPIFPPVCPPIPTEITNAHLPKPSTRCDTLNLLATGAPPNSIVSANR